MFHCGFARKPQKEAKAGKDHWLGLCLKEVWRAEPLGVARVGAGEEAGSVPDATMTAQAGEARHKHLC